MGREKHASSRIYCDQDDTIIRLALDRFMNHSAALRVVFLFYSITQLAEIARYLLVRRSCLLDFAQRRFPFIHQLVNSLPV